MKIAIHHRKGSFSDQWIDYCDENNISYKLVDAYDSDIILLLNDIDVFLWHHHHNYYEDVLSAKKILYSLEQSGIKVFPDFNTGWHFDDKVAQKYLLESINAPHIPSYVFYDESTAINWAKETDFPKVFKLKGGAGASNVILVNNFCQAKKLIKKSFASGFSPYNTKNAMIDDYNNFKKSKRIIELVKCISRIFRKPIYAYKFGREKGYAYFQDFIANNDYDIRMIVINSKYAYGMKRMNRENDFRASGSGKFIYDDIPLEVIDIAFKTAHNLKLQSVAFDFIFIKDKPVIIELSYGFGTTGSSQCPGYWTKDLKWHEGKVFPERWILESFLESNA